MEQKIKQLKNLAIVWEIAKNYDYVPDYEDVDEVHEMLEDGMQINIDKYDLIDLLKKYSGYSPDKVEEETFSLIQEL